jgi:ABC-type phosphate transport system auxiliary subunit
MTDIMDVGYWDDDVDDNFDWIVSEDVAFLRSISGLTTLDRGNAHCAGVLADKLFRLAGDETRGDLRRRIISLTDEVNKNAAVERSSMDRIERLQRIVDSRRKP